MSGGAGGGYPPRPPRAQSAPDLSDFLQEWKEDRREGRTTRVLHEMVQAVTKTVTGHTDRIVALETHGRRDAEERIATQTGRHIIIPAPPALPKSMRPWYLREPLKSKLTLLLIALATAGITTLLHHIH